jgi:threonine/homoserine/homoserine lactone efflux protein
MTNPKAALTWIAIMSLAMENGAPYWVGGTVVAGTTAISITGHLVYALLFSSPPMISVYRRARRWIEMALGAFFCFASFKLLTSRL